jgi:hypothetical protein
MEKIIHICGVLVLSLLWEQEVNAGWPVGDPWEQEEKQGSPELSQQDGEPHEGNHDQEEAE